MKKLKNWIVISFTGGGGTGNNAKRVGRGYFPKLCVATEEFRLLCEQHSVSAICSQNGRTNNCLITAHT